MLNGGDVDIQVHPAAGLVKGVRRWFLAFMGRPGFQVEMQIITDRELGHVLRSGYGEADVIAYIERRMGAAGYSVHRQAMSLPYRLMVADLKILCSTPST